MSAARGRTLIFEVVKLQYNQEATTLLSLLSKHYLRQIISPIEEGQRVRGGGW